jgi:DNA primase
LNGSVAAIEEFPVSFGSSSDGAKELVKQAVDIVDLVGQYVPLRREGRAYKGLCPWHNDSRPSLQVNPERQSFKCWVCGIGGDIFSFVMKQENVSFPEALAMLAERAGVSLGARGGPSQDKHLLYQAMAWAEQQFHDCLLRSEEARPARQYLAERGVTPESIERFHLGYSPESWDWIIGQARQTRFTPKVLETIGLTIKRPNGPGHYDRFRGRVLFSIRDVQCRPVALGGRLLPGVGNGEGAKYINSPETPLFSKSQMLYGLDLAKDAIGKGKLAMVMEGYTDCLIAQQCGFPHAVAVLGTALGERHIKLLRRFADRILLVLDGDEAGRRRTDQILELFVAEQVDLQVLTLPDDLDPADFLLKAGPEAFGKLLEGAVDAVEHKFRQVTAGLNADSGTHEINRALEQMLATLAKAPRLAAGSTSAARLKEDQILHRLAHRLGVGEESVRKRLADLRRKARATSDRAASANLSQAESPGDKQLAMASSGPAPLPPEPAETDKYDLAHRELLELVVSEPQFLGQVRAELTAAEIRSPRLRAVFARCCELADRGQEPDLDRLLLEIDDPQLKTLLVELDEGRQAKKPMDLAAALGGLLAVLRDHREEQRRRARRREANRPASEEEGLDALLDIIERKRRRQGISAPTDG